MDFWNRFPKGRLLAECSLWSADFTRLAEEIARVDPYVDLYHIDVSDDHFVPGLLFFPDLVAALRSLTKRPFHVHLMVEKPLGLIDEFASAGADTISVHGEIGPLVPAALQRIHDRKLAAGIVLGLDVPLEYLLPNLDSIEIVVLMGTPMGVKGKEPSGLAVPRIKKLRSLLSEHGFADRVKIEADGGIRANTVPALRAAGADLVVMGSLAFKSDDLEKTFSWIRSL